MKKDIMLIILNSSYGGAERHVFDICKYLDRNKFNLSIIVPVGSKIYESIKQIEKVEIIPISRGIDSVFKISAILKKHTPDIIHVHSPRATLIVALAAVVARYRGKMITTAHGWIPKRLKLHMAIETVYVQSLKRYSKFISVSNEVKATLIKNNISPENIVTIYNGVEEQSRGVSSVTSKRRFVFLGRYIGEKGLIYLLEALKQLNQSTLRKELYIDFHGDGPLKPLIENAIKEMDNENIRNCGFADPRNVISTLKNYDVLIMPSIQEGFPYTLVEAFSAGIPVIASKVGGIPEALKDGFNGYLTKPGDSSYLQNAIKKFINLNEEELQNLKNNAFASSADFTVQKMVKYIEEVYSLQ
jgi:L-malate glycosyltransferase